MHCKRSGIRNKDGTIESNTSTLFFSSVFLDYFVKLAIIRNRFEQANKRPTTQHVLIDVLRLFVLFNCVACASLRWHWKREEPLSKSQHCILKSTLFRKGISSVQFLNFMVSEFYSGSPNCNNLSRQKVRNPCRDTKSQQYMPNATFFRRRKSGFPFFKISWFRFPDDNFQKSNSSMRDGVCVLSCVRALMRACVLFPHSKMYHYCSGIPGRVGKLLIRCDARTQRMETDWP